MSAISSLNGGRPAPSFCFFFPRACRSERQLVSRSDYLQRKRPGQETHGWTNVFVPDSLRSASAGRLINFWTASRFPQTLALESGAGRSIKMSSSTIRDSVCRVNRDPSFLHYRRNNGVLLLVVSNREENRDAAWRHEHSHHSDLKLGLSDVEKRNRKKSITTRVRRDGLGIKRTRMSCRGKLKVVSEADLSFLERHVTKGFNSS